MYEEVEYTQENAYLRASHTQIHGHGRTQPNETLESCIRC